MTIATKNDLFSRAGRRFRTVEIADLMFRIKSLSEAEKSRFERAVVNKKTGQVNIDARRRLIITMLVDDKGDPLLTLADMEALGELDGAVIAALFDACSDFAGFGDNEIEELEKNCETIAAAVSPTS
tara:strand:- start:1233 stop:1613 length:381 start_codon:yes stop_codon:yes gene_type:complete